MFNEYSQFVLEKEMLVKNHQLDEQELIELIDIVDIRIILKTQNLSTQFIEQYVIPQIDKENKSDPTRPIILEKLSN